MMIVNETRVEDFQFVCVIFTTFLFFGFWFSRRPALVMSTFVVRLPVLHSDYFINIFFTFFQKIICFFLVTIIMVV